MDYIKRELERKFLAMNQVFKAVMVTGARQVGKSTMLKKLAESEERTYVNLDNSRDRELAKSDPGLFFQVYKPPILIDEAQKAPELFEHIKMICDASDMMGLFWLTGSESKKLLKEARDSLAGRICILKMYSLSQREKDGKCALGEMEFSYDKLSERSKHFSENDLPEVYKHIWEGGMPATIGMTAEQRMEYYDSYVVTELLRMYSYSKNKINMTFYRDTNQKEIDIVLEENGILHPLEIKKSSNPDKKAVGSFHLLEKSSLKIGEGGVICMTPKPYPLDKDNNYIPCNII